MATAALRRLPTVVRRLCAVDAAPGSRAPRASSTATAPPPATDAAALLGSVGDAPVVVFHKSSCAVCRDLLERLEDGLGAADVRAVDLVALPERGDALRAALRARTGQQHVPFVFIGGDFMATDAALKGLRRPPGAAADVCELRARLAAAGATVAGPFRA